MCSHALCKGLVLACSYSHNGSSGFRGVRVSVQFPEQKALPKVSVKMLTSGTNLRKAERLRMRATLMVAPHWAGTRPARTSGVNPLNS